MRLLVISNRLPITLEQKGEEFLYQESAGGLVSGISAYLNSLQASRNQELEYVWIGWPGLSVPEERQQEVRKKLNSEYHAHPVFLAEKAMDKFYHGFCNKTLWPLFHCFTANVICDGEYWTQYQSVNESFCQAVEEILRPDDIIWVHDYQLMLLPKLLREKAPESPIGFFLHIPFPSFEIYRMLPKKWSRQILEGILGASLVGFHTHDYAQYFLRSVQRTLGFEHKMGQLIAGNQIVKVDTFPMGIDFNRFFATAASGTVQKKKEKLQKPLAGYKVILSVDRLNYTKGVINRLQAYELFLERHPEWHGQVILVMKVVPSRIGVEHYRQMKKKIDELVGSINGRFGTIHWTPTLYQYNFVPFEVLVALYGLSDVALITPLRDGMNLVAKEYIASRNDQRGVLILSEMAGAAKELGEAVIVNPNDQEEIVDALQQALTMPVEEQRRRNRIMQDRLRRYDVIRWANDFIQHLRRVKEEQKSFSARVLGATAREDLLKQFREASKRIVFLDYDGTLVSFVPDPEKACPDEALLRTLRTLTEQPNTELVIISGRDRNTLENWIGKLPVGIVAEHGAYLRRKGESWTSMVPKTADWKPQIRHILELFVDRLPGSMIEEKTCSLVWHYRKADSELGSMLEKELIDELVNYTATIDLQVLQGSRVVEVRMSGVNKGVGGMHFLNSVPYDFILSIGDDWTDEDLFQALPKEAYSIKVGMTQSHARYNLEGTRGVRALLDELVASNVRV
ncbi:MAG: bifunctional alpha,alpha-trehalose-phosphate synthase (UDP-forming)/trehalose-phosphatase [Candidatus Omnitrophota bacterium]|nr:bifunctional alpha,alpha-trehalose-phosphate synthase (UDP-forming)/trehalose-phosphatase [Candidatus Omnitrophota bacterium]